MDTGTAGAINLAGFVRATAGRVGTSTDLRGGVGVAGPIAVGHSYVEAAIPTDLTMPASTFLDDAVSFFRSIKRAFVVWVPSSAASYLAEISTRGLTAHGDPSPAMVATKPVATTTGPRIRLADDEESLEAFGDVCERGYEQPGMAWLMARQQSYQAPDSYCHIAFDGDVAVSAACGFRTSDTGGVYSVATPPEFRGRGFGAAVTSAATNHLFELGVTRVVLQSSTMGYGVYERLGFRTYDHYERFSVGLGAPQT